MVISYSYVKLPESALGSADFKHQTLAGQGAIQTICHGGQQGTELLNSRMPKM